MIETIFRELRFGIRSSFRDRGFAATVVLTLMVCIAANALTFAVVNSVLLRPLPIPEADNIVLMSNRYPHAGAGDSNNSGAADFVDRTREMPAVIDVALFRDADRTLDLNGTPEQVRGMGVTPSFFRLVRMAPALGRAFTPEEGEIGEEKKVILSDGLWRQLFNGRPDAVGKTLHMGGMPYTVVGVMPAGFNFVRPEVRLWTPLALSAEEKQQHHNNSYYNVARLKPGATMAQAQAQVDALNRANLEREPLMKEALVNAGFHTAVEPLQEMLVKGVRNVLYLLWAAAIVVLLIGALNVANLALARLASRRKEVATRLALGATRGQLARQSIIESMVVTMAGGLLGILAASSLLPALAAAGIDRFPRAGEVRVDVTVAVISLALAAAVGVVMGLLPVANLFQGTLSNSLREDNRTGTSGAGTRRLRQVLVAAEVGFAFVLLVGAGLLLSSFRNLLQIDPGYSSEGVLTASTSIPGARYEDGQLNQVAKRLVEAARTLPGVEAAGVTTSIPLGDDYSDSVIFAEGYVMKPGESVVSPRYQSVSPGYFATMKMPVVKGRDFEDRDLPTSAAVIIVDEKVAQRFWPNRDPIGQRMYRPESASNLQPTPTTKWLTVVGVVKSIRLEDLTGGNPMGAYYFPFAQRTARRFTLALKSRSGSDLTRAVRSEVARVDPLLALFDVRTMSERTELSLASRRTSMTLALGFGALALFLSALGIYGVLAYLVTQRRREIGIRVALGSTGAGVVKLVLGEGFVLVGSGLAAGLVGAIAMQQAVAKEIYGIAPLDPIVLSLVMLTLAAISLLACILPARRALQVDPAIVLTE